MPGLGWMSLTGLAPDGSGETEFRIPYINVVGYVRSQSHKIRWINACLKAPSVILALRVEGHRPVYLYCMHPDMIPDFYGFDDIPDDSLRTFTVMVKDTDRGLSTSMSSKPIQP